jgi:hypothetical protein
MTYHLSNLFIFVSSLKITRFQSSMVQFSHVWANLRHVRTCLQLIDNFFCCTCAPNPTSLKAHLTVMSDNNLFVLRWTCFVVVDALPSRPSVIRVTQRLFSRSARSFGHPPLYLSILPTTSFLICAKEDWLMLPKSTTLQVETPLLNWTKVWCFYSWDNGGIWPQMILQIVPCVLWNQGYTMHKKSHNVLSYAMHKEMSMLEEWHQTKASIVHGIVTLTTSTFPILETL